MQVDCGFGESGGKTIHLPTLGSLPSLPLVQCVAQPNGAAILTAEH